MKRAITGVLVILLCAAVVSSCGQSDDPSEATQAPTVAVTAAPATETAAPPTERPTSAPPTEAPTATPTEAPEAVDAAWFHNAVFIGDSVTKALSAACTSDPKLLGDAKFLYSEKLSYHNATQSIEKGGSIHPVYQNKPVQAETAAQLTDAGKVFIMLGANDFAAYTPEDTLEKAKDLAQRILSHSPGVSIYFQSATPLTADGETEYLTNNKITRFNAMLQTYCEETDYHFVDIYHAVCDDDGCLKTAYCSDPEEQGIHLNSAGCDMWVKALRTSVGADPFGDSEPDVINFEAPTVTSTAAVQPTAGG